MYLLPDTPVRSPFGIVPTAEAKGKGYFLHIAQIDDRARLDAALAINIWKPGNYSGVSSPQEQGAYSKHSSAGEKQHNFSCFYDAGEESVHHTHLRKLALRQALTTDLATGRAELTSIRLISNSGGPEANARKAAASAEMR